ncbi:hypothetical protein ACFCV9_00130 [Streptomyces sp. NPDC056367]|uniref:hypothetical protein n=1 Tax=Streptomyces sp. NPDC056367 TaxID=3345797 RepID=UPI0035E251E4
MTLIPAVRGSDRYVIGTAAGFTAGTVQPVAAGSADAYVPAVAARHLGNGRLPALTGTSTCHVVNGPPAGTAWWRSTGWTETAPPRSATTARTAGVAPLPAALNGVVACREMHSYPMVK